MKQKQHKTKTDELLDYEPLELPKEPQYYGELLLLFLLCFVSTYLLFMIDIDFEMEHLLSPNMLAFSMIYTVPAFIVSFFLFDRLVHVYEKNTAVILSAVVAIPLVFSLLIYYLS